MIIDAKTYSAATLFTYYFKHFKLGKILGVDPQTGSGAGVVWSYEDLKTLALDLTAEEIKILNPNNNPKYQPEKLFPQLEKVDMSVTVARARFTDEEDPTNLEENGVHVDYIHTMTKSDLLNNNYDLLLSLIHI